MIHVPLEPFRITRGLRQGDSISPFLFNMVAEALNFVIIRGCEQGVLAGLPIGKDRVMLLICNMPMIPYYLFPRIISL